MTRFAPLWLSLVVGCASPMSAMRDDNRRLTKTVSELRTDRRAQERKLRDLQRQLDKARAQIVTAVIDGSMPTLPVEVAAPAVAPLGSTESRVVGIADDGSEIVYEGDAAAGKVATFDDDPAPRASVPARVEVARRPGPGRIEITRRAPVSARSTRAPTRERSRPPERTGDAATEYRFAMDLVRAGGHVEAITALRAFLDKNPRHDYADNAQYWLGEAYYAQKDYPHALTEFRTVIETYPRGNKVPDALLKVGFCYSAMGQTDKARAVLEQVVNLYPKTDPAALAAKRLETP